MIEGGAVARVFFSPLRSEESAHTVSTATMVNVSDGLSTAELTLPPTPRYIPLVLLATTSESLGSRIPCIPIRIDFRIVNRGDTLRKVTWSARCEAGGGSRGERILELKAGEARDLSYEWRPEIPGEAVLRITASEGERDAGELLWKARIIPTPFPAMKPPLSRIVEDADGTNTPTEGHATAAVSEMVREKGQSPPWKIFPGTFARAGLGNLSW
jgi:hypothetical protein